MAQLTEDEKRAFALIASDLREDGVGGIKRGRIALLAVLWLAGFAAMIATIQITILAFAFFLIVLFSTTCALELIWRGHSGQMEGALVEKLFTRSSPGNG